MQKSEVLHTVLLCAGAAVLAGALAFLYNKTQAIDLRQQNEILGLVNELKDIDNRWDMDVTRARSELPAAAAPNVPAVDRAAAVKRALAGLTTALETAASPSLAKTLPELRSSLEEKAALVAKFKTENGSAQSAVRDIVAAAGELATQAGSGKTRLPGIENAAATLGINAPLYYLLGQDSQKSALESAATTLRSAPENLREAAGRIETAIETLLRARPAGEAHYAKLMLQTAGPRLNALTHSLNGEIEAAGEDRERYRVYLIAYAGALLVLLAYFGGNLKAANLDLERRVQLRTRELSEALQHLKESEAQLIQSEKMSSLGQMVAGVAHEINTPLAYVKNSLGTVSDKLPALNEILEDTEALLALLRAGNDADGLARQFAKVSGQLAQLKEQGVLEELSGLVKDGLFGTGQMAEIVGNLKDFSRLDRSKVTSFDVNDGLKSTLLLAKHLLKSVTVNRQFGQISSIVCSPSQINQVFLNLVTNAAQAMGDRPGEITLTSRNEGDGVAVEVADNGSGIPPDVLPKIFDPFFSTKAVGKGTGLGLSISYKIVQQHGGRIDVQSEVGKGTRFTVWLPLKPPADAALAA